MRLFGLKCSALGHPTVGRYSHQVYGEKSYQILQNNYVSSN
jgi:hypothetical protein